MSPQVLEAVGISCHRGGRAVFESLHLKLEGGDALVLRGANGTGKTSLLRLLAGFLAPVAGRIEWGGRPLADDLAGHRTRVHFLGFNNALHPTLSARENLVAMAGIAGADTTAVEQSLSELDLAAQADLPVRWLSTGQRRRLALARLKAAWRPLWLLDEPEAGLDVANTARLEAMIAAHRRAGGITVLATHRSLGIDTAHLLDFGT